MEDYVEMPKEFLTNLFEMQDMNKWLKTKAETEEQIEQINRHEKKLQDLLKKICVPTTIENA